MRAQAPITIVGSGLAGYTVAREFRKLDATAPLQLVTADDGSFYSKPMLSTALTQRRSPTDLASHSAARMGEQLRMNVLTGTRVQAIDRQRRILRLSEGELPYSRLVLALGAQPRRLAVPGASHPRVMAVNDLADYRRFRQLLEGSQRIVIVGAGLVGCEFANDLASAGYGVSVVDSAAHPLPGLVPPAVGERLRIGLAALGVRWHLGARLLDIAAGPEALSVQLEDGAMAADLVLSAIGIEPATELARIAGLAVHRAIAVDNLLCTSDPDIFALGDCAVVEGLHLPFVLPIMYAARALARTLAGVPTPVEYPALPVVLKTPAFPVVACARPATDRSNNWRVESSPDGIAAYTPTESAGEWFALGGCEVGRKERLLCQLPPLLPRK